MKKISVLLLSAFAAFAAILPAVATIGVTVNDTDISAGSAGTGATAWKFFGSALTLKGAGPYVISGNNRQGSSLQIVYINVQADCTVVASNLVLDDDSADSINTVSALTVGSSQYAVTLLLSGANKLVGGGKCAGIAIGNGSGSLTISNLEASATLVVRGGSNGGAGIGSGDNAQGGKVVINGGTVTATGGGGGAGIGGGSYGQGGTVVINGGTVTATGSSGGAGIGGGSHGLGGTVTVSGGTVIATGDRASGAEDIGHGSNKAASGANTFTGGSILLTNRSISPMPSNGTARVWYATLTGITSAALLADITNGLAALSPAYGVHGIVARDGKVCIWLPIGAYPMTINGTLTQLVVAEPGHITVNGTAISAGSGTDPAWTYNGSTLALTTAGASYVINGDNGTNTVSIQAQADCTVVASNLVIDVSGTGDAANNTSGLVALDCGAHAVTLALWNDICQTSVFKGGNWRAGIRATGGSLAITNLNESAALSVQGGNLAAGIGGNYQGACGNVTVHGGKVSATGGSGGAGIGGGQAGWGGTVTVCGGTVTATGGLGGAGIGGGQSGSVGTVTISGGFVSATGGDWGAGIGGGVYGAVGTVTVSGGTVTATGGNSGAGIGGGYSGAGGTVTVSGGTVLAKRGGQYYQDIGGWTSAASGANTFTGGSIRLFNGTISQAPSNGAARVWCVTVTGLVANAALTLDELEMSSPYGGTGIVADAAGKVYLWLPDGDYSFILGVETWRAHVNGADMTACYAGVAVNGADIRNGSGTSPDWTYDGTNLALTAAGASYVISGNNGSRSVSIQARADCTVVASNLIIDVSGTGNPWTGTFGVTVFDCGTHAVTLALWSDAGRTNTLKSGYGRAGIRAADGSLVLVYGGGSAALFAEGGNLAAGIGGNGGEGGGSVKVSSGSVSALGGDKGAGIGGGYQGAGGNVTVSGGTVAATGGERGAGIGGGFQGTGGSVKVSGGSVAGIGGERGAGIGGGFLCAGGSVEVSGGTVVATGGLNGAGIGGGYQGAGGTAAISGGMVIATGDRANGAEDIGHGYDMTSSGANTFTGGSIRLVNGTVSPVPSNGTARVWCAAFTNITTAAALANLVNGLSGLLPAYGVHDIAAPDGTVYAWLPAGASFLRIIDGAPTWQTVDDGGNIVSRPAEPVGVTVNGRDISYCIGGTAEETNEWSYNGANLSLSDSGSYVVSGTNGTNAVTITTQFSQTVVLSNLTIDVSACAGRAAFVCDTHFTLIRLYGSNTLTSASRQPGILVPKDCQLSIISMEPAAALVATGGDDAAGIGGAYSNACGAVRIFGGTVTAAGKGGGAGIGGGAFGDGGRVLIEEGFVTVSGGNGAAGIGGGWDGNGGTLYVAGGTVRAIRGDRGSESAFYDIGGEIDHGTSTFTSGANTFTGGNVWLANGLIANAPSNGLARVWCVAFTNIASAAALADLTNGLAALDYGVRDITALDGKVYAWLPSGTYFLTLGGKPARLTIDADGSADFQPAALIGVTVGGRDIAYGPGASGAANDWSYNGANLSFRSAGPYVVSGANGTNSVSLSPKANGTTTLVLSNLTIDVSALAERTALGCGGHKTTLRLLGTNTLKSGIRRPGVQTTGTTLAITNLEPAAALVATGGGDGAGIGGAQSADGGTVWIYGGVITAAGTGGGSGIGGGAYGNGGNVKIFGGLVTASGGNGGSGIGGGWDGNGGTLEVSGGTVRAIRGDRGSVSKFYDIGGEIDHGTSTFTNGANIFTGGSVWLANGLIAAAPSNGTERVWCVTNGGFTANAHLVVAGLPTTYGVNDIYADAGGKVYLWLPAGGYIEGGTAAAGSFLQGFGVSSVGAVIGPTNVALVITGFTPEAGVTNWTPKALSQAHVETVYATDLTNDTWSADRPTNAPALFMKLQVK